MFSGDLQKTNLTFLSCDKDGSDKKLIFEVFNLL